MLRTSEPERHWQGSLAPEGIRQSPSLTTAGGPFERTGRDAQLPARADAAPFVGAFAPTCTGVTPAAVRSGRVYVRRGGCRAAVRSAWKGPRSSA
jgi:hypothetical protein